MKKKLELNQGADSDFAALRRSRPEPLNEKRKGGIIDGIHYQKGQKNKVAFVFSCPGRHEKDAGHPAAKATGTNLKKLLLKLSQILNRDDLTRENITIANAWDRVDMIN